MAQLYNRCTKFYLLISGVETEIREPINWSSISITLKRDTKYYGINFEFSDGEILLKFDCKTGKPLLDNLYQTNGNDSEVFLLFDEISSDGITRSNLFTGKLDFNTFTCEEITTSLSVKKVYFNDLLRSRFDIKTSLAQMTSLDGLAVQNDGFKDIELHSKTIRKITRLEQSDDEEFNRPIGEGPLFFSIGGGGGTEVASGSFYLQWGFDSVVNQDAETVFLLPVGTSLLFPDAWIFEAFEAGIYQIDLLLRGVPRFIGFRDGSISTTNNLACGGDGYWNEVTIATYVRHTDLNGVTIADYLVRVDNWTDSNPACHNDYQWLGLEYDESYTNSITLAELDRVYLYSKIDVSGDYRQPVIGPRNFEFQLDLLPYRKGSFLNIQADTITAPSNAKLMLVHEALSKLVANITNVNAGVKSDFFGRVDYFDRNYTFDGCGGFLSLQNGLGVRGFSPDNKPAFVSLSETIDSLQAIYNIGVQFSTEERFKQAVVWSRKYSTLAGLEGVTYEAITNTAYTYTVLLDSSPTAEIRAYTANVDIYINDVLTYTLSVNEITTGDSQAFTSAEKVRVEINTITGSENTDFARLQITESQGTVIADVVEVEHFDHFFQDVEILQIDSFENYTEEVATDYIFNAIKTGYSKWENEQVNGLDEFATEQENALPIRTARVTKQAISSFVASGYAIEFSRRLAQGTEDGDFDNDIFAIQLRREGIFFETEKDEPFDVVSNIIDPPTAYNLRLSPKRNLLNWASYINNCLRYKANTEEVKFVAGDGNFDLETQFNISEPCRSGDNNRILLSEKGNVALTDFNGKSSPLRPELLKFRAIVDFDTLFAIKDTPFGYISVLNTPKGDVKGYILEMEYNPNIEAGYTDFTLIKKAE